METKGYSYENFKYRTNNDGISILYIAINQNK